MPCDEEGLQLVAEVGVGDWLAGAGRSQKRGEQATWRWSRAARLPDLLGHEGVDSPEGAPIATGRQRRNFEPTQCTPETTVDVAHGHIQGVTERLDLRGGDIAEARPDDDRLGQASHLGYRVDGLASFGQ